MTANHDTEPPDLEACAREPIHIPGAIQPHGVLMCLDENHDFTVLQISETVEALMGKIVSDVVGRPLATVLGDEAAECVVSAISSNGIEQAPTLLDTVELNGRTFHVLAHRYRGTLIVEFEPAVEHPENLPNLIPQLRKNLARLHEAHTAREAAMATVRHVRQLTGFDRVLVYQFDNAWNGHVIAEDRDPELTPYLDLCFPASDIPPQARELYRLSRTRLIADASYRPSPVVPELSPRTGLPLDLSYSVLRSVSPVHLEYLQNMGVATSMSFSIVAAGKLWGLISCHHRTPRAAPIGIREACDFAAQALSSIVVTLTERAEYERRIRNKSIMTQLLAYMTEHDQFMEGLRHHPGELLAFAAAGGAAIVWEGNCSLIGATPSEQHVLALTDWLVSRGREDLFCTDRASQDVPDGADIEAVASGILAISISKLYRSFVVWFRPEVVRTVTWGGDPNKAVSPSDEEPGRLHPRKSFEAWKETVRGRSKPWHAGDVETAREFRNAIVGVVLRKAEELGQLSADLQRSNQELEAFSYSVSHDLRAPFRHIVGYAEMLRDYLEGQLDERSSRYIETIIESAQFAGTLVDNLLSFSRIGRSRLSVSEVNMAKLTAETIGDFALEARGRNVEWRVQEMPTIRGDLLMLRTAFQNLVSNALKYTRQRDRAVIEIAADEGESEWVFSVRDNGVGFDPRYVDKLFGIFQRLHRMEEFEGTGIGLANVRRIAARHGGRTWAEGEPGAGAAFYLTISKRIPERIA